MGSTSPQKLRTDDWGRIWKHSQRLYNYVNPLIFNYVRHYVLAEDIVAETLRYAREHPEQWRNIPDDRIFHYLRQKARRLVIDHARKYLRQREWMQKEGPQKNASKKNGNEPSPLRTFHKGEKQEALHDILGRLKNDTHRAVLHMVWLDGLTVGQAAEKIGRTTQATQMLLARAFQACRSIARRESFAGFRISGETV